MKFTAKALNIITGIGLALCIAFIVYAVQEQLFTSQDKLNAFLGQFGIYASLVFVLFQAIQVVIPVLPGGLGCLAGVIFFGPVYGFLYNYIGICIGSVVAFVLAKRYGNELVKSITKAETYNKYIQWVDKGKNFDKWLAFAIFMPVAPDDLLCYIAGLTRMTVKKFTGIILLFKPFGILAYSFGLNLFYTQLLNVIGG